MSKKILITGASGLIGTRLTELLLIKDYSVVHLGRTKKEGNVPSLVWDISNGTIEKNWLHQVDVIIHLAGAGIADKRWTRDRKKEILDSRIKSTDLLLQTLKNNAHTVKSLIAASAIGYYGFDEDKIFVEEDLSGKDFLANVTKEWEAEVDKLSSLGLRMVKLRIGIVLSERGGALVEMAKPVKFGLGSPLGTGKQFLSWIHLDDLCEMFIRAIEDKNMNGAYNATAAWCTNEEMTKAIARVLKKPLWLPSVPAFVLKIILGEMAEIVLKGSKVSSEKIRQTGFHLKFLKLEGALKEIFKS